MCGGGGDVPVGTCVWGGGGDVPVGTCVWGRGRCTCRYVCVWGGGGDVPVGTCVCVCMFTITSLDKILC